MRENMLFHETSVVERREIDEHGVGGDLVRRTLKSFEGRPGGLKFVRKTDIPYSIRAIRFCREGSGAWTQVYSRACTREY